jgi:hypothetical protein
MTDYITEIQEWLKRHVKSFPDIPDGVYPMKIDGKIDYVKIKCGKIFCCNFDAPKRKGLTMKCPKKKQCPKRPNSLAYDRDGKRPFCTRCNSGKDKSDAPKIGRPISRRKALKLSNKILRNAEKKRLEYAEREAKI